MTLIGHRYVLKVRKAIIWMHSKLFLAKLMIIAYRNESEIYQKYVYLQVAELLIMQRNIRRLSASKCRWKMKNVVKIKENVVQMSESITKAWVALIQAVLNK